MRKIHKEMQHFMAACKLYRCCSHLGPAHTDDAIDAAAGIVEEGHGDGVFTGRQPVPFGGRVDLEDVSSGAEDGLLPSRHKGNESTLACSSQKQTFYTSVLLSPHKKLFLFYS